jgi:hypothetical protein
MPGGCLILSFALAVFALSTPSGALSAEADAAPLKQAHAHNDYLHERPLLDALSHGFTSVEADIFLVDGDLLVAHEKAELKPERTLRGLYLDPLRDRVKRNQGSVHPNGGPFHLLIDIKTAAEPTYAVLDKMLAEYDDIISVVRDGQAEPKAVQVVVSGNRPQKVMAQQSLRRAGIDGRLSDLDSEVPPHLMPLVSDNWNVHFRWRGKGPISDADRAKLADAVKRAHAHGRRIRFWATPETVDAWRELQAAGVDHINTDNLMGLEDFLRNQSNPLTKE